MTHLLTVFSNFRIDSPERLLRLKDSFRSFRDANIGRWVINIRGSLKEEAGQFLTKELGTALYLSYVESGRGWFADTRTCLPKIDSEYVLYWVEDQLCVSGSDYLDRVVADMHRAEAELLLYTAFHAGDQLRSFELLAPDDFGAIQVLDYDRLKHRRRLKWIKSQKILCAEFVVSLTSVFSRALFERILSANDPLIKRWPIESPFDVEKTQKDSHWLPIRIALLKQELFAYIDDDHGRPGHSLVSRGRYPDRVSRAEMLKVREENFRISGGQVRWALLRPLKELVNRLYSLIRRLPGLRFMVFL